MNLGNHGNGCSTISGFAVRSQRRGPEFGATTIVSLALGVALTASTPAVRNSAVFRTT